MKEKAMLKRLLTHQRYLTSLLLALVSLLTANAAFAQSSAFTYQGRLTEANTPANSIYDMQFKLFDTAGVGTGIQQGQTFSNASVEVTSGVFSVSLDFGANVFDGSPRFLEVGIRPAGSNGPYTVLA